jgi:rhodanese-related sulfurtransferase
MKLTPMMLSYSAALCSLIASWFKHGDSIEQHRITPETLREQITSGEAVLLLDVRQPLDLLAHSEMIPGAKRIPPKELLANPSLIPKEKEAILYCTCPSDKTSKEILRLALSLGFTRIKFLEGGLEGWKAKGYPVEPYQETFHLDIRR